MSTEDDLWKRILARIAASISQGCFDTWFRPVAFACREGNTLHLSVPSDAFRKSLIDNYRDVLHEAVAEVAGCEFTVDLTTSARAADQTPTGNGTVVPLPVVQASALEVPTVRHTWLIDQLWADQAVGVIGGGPKLGKSWLALDMAVSIASGTPCLGT
jgi:chromosomal replication initiation ATPase DnaA